MNPRTPTTHAPPGRCRALQQPRRSECFVPRTMPSVTNSAAEAHEPIFPRPSARLPPRWPAPAASRNTPQGMNESRSIETDALQIERSPKILGNVDVQAIAIGIDEACNGARPSGQQICSRSKPSIPSRPLDQFSGCRSNRIGDKQNDSDEKPSVHIHPQYCEEWQGPEDSRDSFPLFPVQSPPKHRGEERGYKMWSRQPVYGARRRREAGQNNRNHSMPRFCQCAPVNADRRSPQEQQAHKNNSG